MTDKCRTIKHFIAIYLFIHLFQDDIATTHIKIVHLSEKLAAWKLLANIYPWALKTIGN